MQEEALGLIETRGFVAMVEALPMDLAAVTQRELGRAGEILRKFSDQDLTLADAVGLDLMKTRRIKSCWSTDRHLGLTGVRLVIFEH